MRISKPFKSRPGRTKAGDIFNIVILLFFGAFMLIPMIFVVVNAFKPLDELFVYPPRLYVINPTLDNFRSMSSVLEDSWVPFFRYIFNTVFVTLSVTAGYVIVASMAGYVLEKKKFPGKHFLFRLVVVSMMFSPVVTAIPNYLIMSKLNWVDTYLSVIVPAIGGSLGVFLIKQFMVTIPDEILEAARVDGAGEQRIFWIIIMPNMKSAWLTLVIFTVQKMWGATGGTYIYSEELKMLPTAMSQIVTGGIVDISTMPNDMYAILDSRRCRVFVYSADGELYYEFGGPGEYLFGFTTPTALEYFDNKFYIVDTDKNQLKVFSVNEYGMLFNDVSKAISNVDYKAEKSIWQKIISKNSNCNIAIRGLGMAAYREKDMQKAMEYFKKANDKEYYSKAFTFVRRNWIENNAVLFLLCFVVIALCIFSIKIVKKRISNRIKGNSLFSELSYASNVCFHPLNGFWNIRREGKIGVLPATILLISAGVVTVLKAICTGFIFNSNELSEYNWFFDIAILFGGITLWCICQWCVTVLMDGEGKLKDIYVSTCYALTPYIFLSVFSVIISLVLTQNESEFYSVLVAVSLIYCAFLLVISVKQTHDYSMVKTFLVIMIILVVILLILFVMMLIIALLQQMFAFCTDLTNEISLRL